MSNKTREEIIQKAFNEKCPDLMVISHGLNEAILEAMEQYSLQQAIAFSDWVQKNEYFLPEGRTSYVKRTGQETKFSNNQFIKPETLYDLFISQSLNKDK